MDENTPDCVDGGFKVCCGADHPLLDTTGSDEFPGELEDPAYLKEVAELKAFLNEYICDGHSFELEKKEWRRSGVLPPEWEEKEWWEWVQKAASRHSFTGGGDEDGYYPKNFAVDEASGLQWAQRCRVAVRELARAREGLPLEAEGAGDEEELLLHPGAFGMLVREVACDIKCDLRFGPQAMVCIQLSSSQWKCSSWACCATPTGSCWRRTGH